MSDFEELYKELKPLIKRGQANRVRQVVRDIVDLAISDHDDEYECPECDAWGQEVDQLEKEIASLKEILSLLGVNLPLSVADEIAIRTGRYEINHGQPTHGAR